MHKILFLTFDWNYNIAHEYNLGIHRFVEDHPDTNVYVFNGMGKYNEVGARDRNFEIFNIPELENYDGVAFQGNLSWPVKNRQSIADQCKAKGIPTVSINYPLEGSTYIGTDNYEAMTKMVTHLIIVHGIKHPYFISGLSTSDEAIQRRKAFIDTCEHYSIHDYKIIEGDWVPASGMKAAEDILKEGKENLPDALICSNDDEAIGALEIFERNGIHAPEDILVTGFDNRDIAIAHEPRLTSVSRDYATVLYTAMDTLYQKIHQEIVKEQIYSPVMMKYEGTCGCCTDSNRTRSFKDKFFRIDTSFKKYFWLQNYLHEDMIQSTSITELIAAFEKHMDDMQMNTAYLMVDRQYLYRYDSEEHNYHYSHSAVMMASNDPKRGEYEERNHVYDTLETAQIMPQRLEKQGGMQYNVYPVSSSSSCIGWIVTEGVSTAAEYNTIQLILLMLATDIEIIRKSSMLKHVNNRLENLYITDQLTGLYNRFGMEHFGRFFFRKCLIRNKSVWITFLDIDEMKKINDLFGHEQGDAAIKDSAEIIKNATIDREVFAMRYGGDEFLIISMEPMRDLLLKSLINYHETEKRLYYLTISVGDYEVTKDSESLDTSITLADQNMYVTKQKKKKEASAKKLK